MNHSQFEITIKKEFLLSIIHDLGVKRYSILKVRQVVTTCSLFRRASFFYLLVQLFSLYMTYKSDEKFHLNEINSHHFSPVHILLTNVLIPFGSDS